MHFSIEEIAFIATAIGGGKNAFAVRIPSAEIAFIAVAIEDINAFAVLMAIKVIAFIAVAIGEDINAFAVHMAIKVIALKAIMRYPALVPL